MPSFNVFDNVPEPQPVWLDQNFALLQSTAAGEGTALLGSNDVGNYYTGTTAETQLQEIAARVGTTSILVTEPRFGAVGNGVADDTAAILAAKTYAAANLPCRIVFPSGTYRITSSLGNWAYKGLTLEGVTARASILKFEHSGQAFIVDAFQAGWTANDATAPFIYRFNMSRLVFQGNTNTTDLVFARGITQSIWSDLLAREANTTTGVGYNLQGCMLNTFTQVSCSINQDAMSFVPNNGLRIGAGTRNGSSIGNSTNNSFINCYAEGNVIGWWLTGADQNTFINGAPEGCTQYGCLIAGISKMNTFIGVGFENPSASTAGCADGGLSNKFINCYNSTLHDCQGDKSELSGGFYEKINVNGSGAAYNYIHDLVINHWATGVGGFTDTGTGTQSARIFDDDIAAEIFPYKARTSITVTASPFVWTNDTGRRATVILQTGTLTQVRGRRGADGWLAATTTVPQSHVVLPGDGLEVSYTVAPGMSYLPHNVSD